MNFMMDRESFRDLRRQALKDLDGVVLEIGFGTGLNLPVYPKAVQKIIAVDPADFSNRYLVENHETGPSIEFIKAPGEALPIENDSVDHVVTTWTLCSVKNPSQVLSEIRRVLKPGGTYVFVEHGKSPEQHIAKLQDWLTPVQKCIGQGCHLNRKIDDIISHSSLHLEKIENLYMKGPKIAAYLYIGIARKTSGIPWELAPSSRCT
jgi:ubiquinone/menaquinone biosynthesis C-methylase UbiE